MTPEESASPEFNPGDGWREVPPEDRRAEVQWYGNPAGLDPVKAWIRVPPVPPLPTGPWTVIRVDWKPRKGDVQEVLTRSGAEDIDRWYLIHTEQAFEGRDLLKRITGFEVLAEPVAS